MQRRLTKLINRVRVDMARQTFQHIAVVTVRGRGAQPELKRQESRALLEHSGQGLSRRADLDGASTPQGEGEHDEVGAESIACRAVNRPGLRRSHCPPQGDRGRT